MKIVMDFVLLGTIQLQNCTLSNDMIKNFIFSFCMILRLSNVYYHCVTIVVNLTVACVQMSDLEKSLDMLRNIKRH